MRVLGAAGRPGRRGRHPRAERPEHAVAALVAAFGFAARKPWGARATIAVGAVNLVAAVVGAILGQDGWPVGLVLSGLAVVLTVVAGSGTRRVVTP